MVTRFHNWYSMFILPLGFAAAALILTTCGIPTLSKLSPPGFSEGGGIITLTHNTANTVDFQGYNIWYRSFSSQSDAQAVVTTLDGYITAGASTPDSFAQSLLPQRLLQICSISGVVPGALFPVTGTEVNQSIVFSINHLSATPAGSFQPEWFFFKSNAPSTNTIIRRYMQDLSSQNLSFASDYKTTDSDYTGAADSPRGSSLYFVFYAQAYGFSPTSLRNVFSIPASLGTVVQITIP